MTISVILPAYQEAENLKVILPNLKKVLTEMGVSFEILVIDTMEPMDGAREICEYYHAIYKNRRHGNYYGDAIRTGIKDACGEKIVIMDADGSHNPEDIKKFYQEVKEQKYDLVIGSRYTKGGTTHNGFVLQVMSYLLNVTYRVIFHLKVKDVSDSYRMYDALKLKSIQTECQNFDIVEEILIRMKVKYPSMRIKEVPIYFNKRASGESKRDLWKFIQSYFHTIIRLKRIEKKESIKNA